jgi:GxxExxY protein
MGGKELPTEHTEYTEKGTNMADLIHKDETYKILGACFEVYREMGCGFTEAIYQECLELEFGMQSIPYFTKPQLRLKYKDKLLKKKFEPDFVCFELVVVELKSVSDLINDHRAQLQNYLNATGMRVGLLVNFGHYPKLEYERIVR